MLLTGRPTQAQLGLQLRGEVGKRCLPANATLIYQIAGNQSLAHFFLIWIGPQTLYYITFTFSRCSYPE